MFQMLHEHSKLQTLLDQVVTFKHVSGKNIPDQTLSTNILLPLLEEL